MVGVHLGDLCILPIPQHSPQSLLIIVPMVQGHGPAHWGNSPPDVHGHVLRILLYHVSPSIQSQNDVIWSQ